MLEVTRERLYGGPLSRAAKHVYRARVGSTEVAYGETRTEAVTKAWEQIEAKLDAYMCRSYVAVANDGAVITLREYQTGEYELMFHRFPESANGAAHRGMLTGGGSEMGRLLVDEKPVSAFKMLETRLAQYNEACS